MVKQKLIIGLAQKATRSFDLNKMTKPIVSSKQPSIIPTPTKIDESVLFGDFQVFIGEAYEKISKFADDLPISLYKKLLYTIDTKRMNLKQVVSEHYSKLNDCTTLKQVQELYPELKLPNITPKTIIYDKIESLVSTKIVAKIKELALNGNTKAIDNELDNLLNDLVRNSEDYPKIKRVLNEIKENILNGKIKGHKFVPLTGKYGSGKGVGTVDKLYGDNFDDVILQFLRKHYVNGEAISTAKVTSQKGQEVSYAALKKQGYNIPTLPSDFRKTINSIDAKATKFLGNTYIDESGFTSAILFNAWKTGTLKADFAYTAKKFPALSKIWYKLKGQNTIPAYETSNLVDMYLLNKYISGVRTAINPNPFEKFYQMQHMDQHKQKIIHMVYKLAEQNQGSNYKNVLNSKGFLEFKSQFKIDDMIKMFEEMEKHYTNTFLKTFWTQKHKEVFSEALKQSYETAKKNIELSDDILMKATETIL